MPRRRGRPARPAPARGRTAARPARLRRPRRPRARLPSPDRATASVTDWLTVGPAGHADRMNDRADCVVLLDIDGTLVDSTYHHALAWHRAFARHDITLPM